MSDLEKAAWAIGVLVGAYLFALLCKKAYLGGWNLAGGLDNVVAPPAPMLSSGQTNPHVERYALPHSERIPWVNSDQFSSMSNVCVQYTAPMQNRIYEQR